jgi:hypothetical protein
MGMQDEETEENEESYNGDVHEGNKQGNTWNENNQQNKHKLDTNSVDYKLFGMMDPPQISYNIINVDKMADVKIAAYETSNTMDLSLDHHTSRTNEDITMFDSVHYGDNPCQVKIGDGDQVTTIEINLNEGGGMDVDVTSKWLGEDITQYIACGFRNIVEDNDFEMAQIEHGKNHGLSYTEIEMTDNMK